VIDSIPDGGLLVTCQTGYEGETIVRFVVTGGAGFIGSHLVEHLIDDHEVVVIDNLFSGSLENIDAFLDRVEFIQGSITDDSVLVRACEGADGIFHQAAIASVPRSINNPLRTHEANATGTLKVLLSARDAGVRKVVFASSSSVYGDTPTLPKIETMRPEPKSPYAISKLTGEHYCRVFSHLYGLQTVALRYFNVFGPRQDPKSEYAAVIPRFITRILHKEPPIIYGDGHQTRDFTYVKDVVQANIQAMKGDAQGVFNIASHQRTDLLTLASIIMDEIGIALVPIHQPPRPGDVRDSFADINAANQTFHYSPNYTLQSGLRETISWYRSL
jgi:UDP-glucose 4-epimerase